VALTLPRTRPSTASSKATSVVRATGDLPPNASDIDAAYHLRRAYEERSRALRATSPESAAAHFELGRLHGAALDHSSIRED